MITIISPAKKLQSVKSKLHINKTSFPQFNHEAKILCDILKDYNVSQLQDLMHISEDLAKLNQQRYQKFIDKLVLSDNHSPAIFTFAGEVYNGLNAQSFNDEQLKFCNKNLRILSGLYGILKPLDLIQPHRLEMGTKLPNKFGNNLYGFWQDKIFNNINSLNSDNIINLASTEYFKAVNYKKLDLNIITPIFKDYKNGNYKVIMMYAKNARGAMANFIIKNQITNWQDLKNFSDNNYMFNPKLSELEGKNKNIIFTRKI
jgi:cytoplasmic iron level regulating protein YaaA (DUF328/UPF0246 family)